MALFSLLPIFHRLNREYFEGSLIQGISPKVDIRWSDGRMKSTAGLYRSRWVFGHPRESEIILSRPILINLPEKALESTLCHEMIHAWIDLVLKVKEVGHGPLFKERMAQINSVQNDFQVTVRHCFPIPERTAKWIGECSLCHQQFFYKRIVKGAACRNCCNQFFQGQWNKKCLLKYQSLEI